MVIGLPVGERVLSKSHTITRGPFRLVSFLIGIALTMGGKIPVPPTKTPPLSFRIFVTNNADIFF